MPSGTGQTDAEPLERQRLIFNEKCKAQGGFFFNLSVAVIAAGPIAELVRTDPGLDGPLMVVSFFFGAVFYIVGSNFLDRMEGDQ